MGTDCPHFRQTSRQLMQSYGNMKNAMQATHGSAAFRCIAESMLRCNMSGVSWEEF
jgi:hypothetical protein